MRDGEEKHPLWKAVEDGNTARVLALLRDPEEGCVDVDVRYRGWTPLMKAAYLGNVEILRLLLQHRAQVSAMNHKNQRPLDVANGAGFPNRVVIKVLLDHMDLYAKWVRWKGRDGARKSPLWLAVENGDSLDVWELLFDGKDYDPPLWSDVDVRYRGWTPLMKAAELGDVGMLRWLLDYSADVGAENHKGRTPLSFAVNPSHGGALHPNPAAVKILLEHGADMDGRRDHLNLTVLDRVEMLALPHRALVMDVWVEFSRKNV